MSAENGIGTAGRLRPVETEPNEPRLNWPAGKVPFPRIKKDPENTRKLPDWRGICSTLGEIAGIAGISVGCGWYSLGCGLIAAGIGVFAVSFLAGMPE